jgi:hypothetical protein
LDDSIQELLDDSEYAICEEYLDSAKTSILKANQEIGRRLASSETNHSISEFPSAPTARPPVTQTRPPVTQYVNLPQLKLQPFAGDVETRAMFREQFESSIDKDPTISTINKHVFLRGNLKGEPKTLVDGIDETVSAYNTKKMLCDRYGVKGTIIQTHLD